MDACDGKPQPVTMTPTGRSHRITRGHTTSHVVTRQVNAPYVGVSVTGAVARLEPIARTTIGLGSLPRGAAVLVAAS